MKLPLGHIRTDRKRAVNRDTAGCRRTRPGRRRPRRLVGHVVSPRPVARGLSKNDETRECDEPAEDHTTRHLAAPLRVISSPTNGTWADGHATSSPKHASLIEGSYAARATRRIG